MHIICTSLQTYNHASTSSLHIFTGRMPSLPPNQQHQSINHCNMWCTSGIVDDIIFVSNEPYSSIFHHRVESDVYNCLVVYSFHTVSCLVRQCSWSNHTSCAPPHLSVVNLILFCIFCKNHACICLVSS